MTSSRPNVYKTLPFWLLILCCISLLVTPMILLQSMGVSADLTLARLLKFLAAALAGVAAGLAVLGLVQGGIGAAAAGSTFTTPAVVGVTAAVCAGTAVVVTQNAPAPQNPLLTQTEALRADSLTIANALALPDKESQNPNPVLAPAFAEAQTTPPTIESEMAAARVENSQTETPPAPAANNETQAAPSPNFIAEAQPAASPQPAPAPAAMEKKEADSPTAEAKTDLSLVKKYAMSSLGYPVTLNFVKPERHRVVKTAQMRYDAMPPLEEWALGEEKPFVIMVDDKQLYVDVEDLKTRLERERRMGLILDQASVKTNGWTIYRFIRKKSHKNGFVYSVEYTLYRSPHNGAASHLFKIFSPATYKNLRQAQEAMDFNVE